MEMNYLIGTGWYRDTDEAREWRKVWDMNLLRYARCVPRAVTVAVGDAKPYAFDHPCPLGQIIYLPHNLGHVGDLLHGRANHYICGWSATVIALAGLAYAGGTDLIYLEEDALAFGPWINRLYSDLGDGQFIFGAKMTSPPWMQCSQSVFLIRHAFIPTFIREYLSLGHDGDPDNLPEHKFATIEARYRNECRRATWMRDRERPLDYDMPVWSAQKFTAEELAELRGRGLL